MKIEFESFEQVIQTDKKVEVREVSESSDPPIQITFEEISGPITRREISRRSASNSVSGDSVVSSNTHSNRFPGRVTDCLECRMGKHCNRYSKPFCQCGIEGHTSYVSAMG